MRLNFLKILQTFKDGLINSRPLTHDYDDDDDYSDDHDNDNEILFFPDFSKMVRSTAGPPPSPFSPADWLAGSAATQRDSEGW